MHLFRPAFKIASFVMLMWASVMILAGCVSIPDWHTAGAFSLSAACCSLLSGLLALASRGAITRIQPRSLYMATTINWLLLALTGTLPYLLALPDIRFCDALFESFSGITTTGSTIFDDIEVLSRGILIWRSLTQWVGGIGIILVALAVLPSLRSGGMKLFRSEFSEWNQLDNNRISKIALQIVGTYVLISCLCFAAYALLGMPLFDAINHMMSTVSTGGFSTWNSSFGHHSNSHLQLVSSVFMLLGACPFLMIVTSILGRNLGIVRDRQVIHLLLMTFGSALLIFSWRLFHENGQDPLLVWESSLFNVVSIATTTGYASEDYGLWGTFPLIIMGFLMFSGGASGSTSGGIKLFRYHLLYIFTREHIHGSLHDGLTMSRRYNDRPIRDDILVSSLAFFFFVIVSLGVSTGLLAATGLDPVTSFSGSLTSLMNVGPGFGDIIGPVGNFSMLPDSAKYILCINMLLGRLEYFALIVIFTAEFWRW